MSGSKHSPVELLTIAEAARRLTVSPRTVQGLLSVRRLLPIKLARGSTRIDAAEVARFIEDARRKAAL